jgi:diguanylate cyclase (GGDEF)-like protein
VLRAVLRQLLPRQRIERDPAPAFRYATALGVGIALALLFHVFMVPMLFWLGPYELALVNIASAFAWLWASRLHRQQRYNRALLVGGIEIVLHAYIAVWMMGWISGFHYHILSLAILLSFSPTLSLRVKIAAGTGVCAGYLLLFALALSWPVPDQPWAILFHYINAGSCFVLIGVVSFYYSRAAAHSERAIERTNRLLQDLAFTDPLTKLLNRRRMLERVEFEAMLHARSRTPLALLLADIDDFKSFNDEYGHACGDYVLERVAAVLQEVLRGNDWVSRWGGEEFLMMLPHAELDAACRTAERVRQVVERHEFEFAGQALRITLTVGASAYRPGEPVKACIARADAALMAGKRSGKNRVVHEAESVEEETL